MKILDTLVKIIKWCFYAVLIAVVAAMLIRLAYFIYTKLISSDNAITQNETYNRTASSTTGVLESIRSGKAFSFKLPPPGSWSLNLSDPNRPIDWEGQEPSWDNSAGWSSEANWNSQNEKWDNNSDWPAQTQWPSTSNNNANWNYDNTLKYK